MLAIRTLSTQDLSVSSSGPWLHGMSQSYKGWGQFSHWLHLPMHNTADSLQVESKVIRHLPIAVRPVA